MLSGEIIFKMYYRILCLIPNDSLITAVAPAECSITTVLVNSYAVLALVIIDWQ